MGRWIGLFSVVGCTTASKGQPFGDDTPDTATAEPVDPATFEGVGTFQLELVPPRDDAPGQAAILGSVLDGPTPGTVVWERSAEDGDCALWVPRVPFCDPGCDHSEACVEDDICQPYPTTTEVGTVTVAGVATTTGETEFSMEPIAGYYQPAADLDLAWPPVAEGDEVTFSASGNPTTPPFTMTAPGIAPLEVGLETITLADGAPLHLEWTPGAPSAQTEMHIRINISYHAGTRGIIACETADTGALDLSAELVDALKALGISGWPIIVFSRSVVGTTEPDVEVRLLIESTVTRSVDIPGLISCNTDADCPEGQTCQFDFQCG